MNIISYVKNVYGYDVPIFLKDIRIGQKSKTAIKQAFYRAEKNGIIERKSNGVFFFRSKKEFGSGITFSEVIKKKYIYPGPSMDGFQEFATEGYYSGLTFLNMIGITDQVPAVIEVTTNKTSSKKTEFVIGPNKAIIRKGKTAIDFTNYKILQFLDMFHFITLDEVKNSNSLLKKYIKDNAFSRAQLKQYLKFYSDKTLKKIIEGGLFDAFSR